MSSILFTTDIICLLFSLVLLCASLAGSKSKKESTKLFTGLVTLGCLGMASDAVVHFSEKFSDNLILMKTVNLLSYLFMAVIVILFSFYLISVIRESSSLSYRASIPALVLGGIHVCILIVGTINGKLFTIENHAFVEQEWGFIVRSLPALVMLYFYAVMFHHRKSLGLTKLLALGSYSLFPLFLALLGSMNTMPDFTYAAIALSLEIIFIAIQAQTISESSVREKILSEASYSDTLTGLKNRRAFDEILKQDHGNDPVCVIFCDLNSLKYVNDNMGHAAGDAYINKFAQLLRDSFSDGEVCRISGDEFVVLLFGLGSDETEARINAFRDVILQNERIASMGYVHDAGRDITGMVREAEKEMYNDKSKYYKETGKDRRK